MSVRTDSSQSLSAPLPVLVSAVIPTRNRLALLQRALTSVKQQTYPSLEIIVVLDGPDEPTERYLGSLKDPVLKVVALPESVGGAEARNRGVQAAAGDWIAFLDDDDEWLPEKIERQMQRALEDDGAGDIIVACKVIGRYPNQDYTWPRRFPRPDEPLCEYLFNRSSLVRGEGQLQTSMLLVPRSLMLRVPFTRGLKKHQDTDWYLRSAMTEGTHVVFVDEVLTIWHLGGNRETVFTTYDWERSWKWLLSMQPMMTKRAFAGFIATQLITEATAQRCFYSATPFLLWQMMWRGRARAIEYVIFLGNSVFGPGMRAQLRRLLSPRT